MDNTHPTHTPLPTREKLIFGTGDLFIGGSQVIVAFFYLRFLTDVVQISPALAGTIILVSKVWDAISDPLMGVISDNTRTRWGRRKPYLFLGFFGVITSFTLLWYPAQMDSTSAKFAAVLASYLYFSTISTMILVPYASMSSEITTDYRERNEISGIRLFFSQLSSLVGAVVPLILVKQFNDPKVGWMAMGAILSVFYAIPYLVIFFFTHERIPPSDQKSEFKIESFIRPLRIKSFRQLLCMYFMAYLTMDVIASIFQYYMLYYLDRQSEAEYVIGTLLVVQIMLIPAVVLLANRFGKALVYRYSILIWLMGASILAFYQADWPNFSIYIIAGLMGCGVTGCVVMPWSIFPDVTDVGELEYGYRIAGSFSGVMTFTRKFSGAIGIFIVGLILQFSGYLAPEIAMVDGKYTETLQTQPESVITALQLIVFMFPICLLIPAFFIAKKFPLNQQLHNDLRLHLEYKRGERATDNLSPEQLAEMRKTLI